MIFACLGAEGTGKSTVINKLRELGFYASDGFSRPCIRAKLHKVMEPLAYQTFLNELTFHHHYPFTQINVDGFFTRSILDCLAYGRAHGLGGQGDWEEKAISWFNEHRRNYVVLYFPIEFGIEEDGERPADAEHQSKIDQECKKILEELDIDYYEVGGSVESRVSQVLHVKQLVESESATDTTIDD